MLLPVKTKKGYTDHQRPPQPKPHKPELNQQAGHGNNSLDRSCTPLPRRLDRKRHTRNTAQVTQGVNSSIKSPLKPIRELSIGLVSQRLNPTSNLWSSTNNCKPDRFSKLEAHLPGTRRAFSKPTLAAIGLSAAYRAELAPTLKSGRAGDAIWRFCQSLL